jgi:hypothetical protein
MSATQHREPTLAIYSVSPRKLQEHLRQSQIHATLSQCYWLLELSINQLEIAQFIEGVGSSQNVFLALQEVKNHPTPDFNSYEEIDIIVMSPDDLIFDAEENECPGIQTDEAEFLITHYGNKCIEAFITSDYDSIKEKLTTMRTTGFKL